MPPPPTRVQRVLLLLRLVFHLSLQFFVLATKQKKPKLLFLVFLFSFSGVQQVQQASEVEERIRGYSYERYKIIPCSSSLFLHFINAHTYINNHAIHCPSPKRPKDQRRLHRQGRQRKVHDGLETARQQVSTDSEIFFSTFPRVVDFEEIASRSKNGIYICPKHIYLRAIYARIFVENE